MWVKNKYTDASRMILWLFFARIAGAKQKRFKSHLKHTSSQHCDMHEIIFCMLQIVNYHRFPNHMALLEIHIKEKTV